MADLPIIKTKEELELVRRVEIYDLFVVDLCFRWAESPARWSAQAFRSEPIAQLSLRADVMLALAARLGSDHGVPFPR